MNNTPITHGILYGMATKIMMSLAGIVFALSVSVSSWYLSNINTAINNLTSGLNKSNEINHELMIKFDELDKDINLLMGKVHEIEKNMQSERIKNATQDHLLERHATLINERLCARGLNGQCQ